ncbi:hypothetical protein EMIT0111MI5_80130 [Burkholderia sp. IT-111MI5]
MAPNTTRSCVGWVMDGSFGAGVSRASVPLALLSGFIEGLQGRRQVQDLRPPSAQSNLVGKLIKKPAQAIMADVRQPGTGRSLKTRRQLQQFRAKVIDRESRVVELACRGVRIGRVIQRAAHPAGDIEAPCDTQHADRIEPVGILQRFCFQRHRRNTGRKTMRFDRMRDRIDLRVRPIQRLQHQPGLFRRQPRRLRPKRGVFLYRDAIVQQRCRKQHFGVSALVGMDRRRVLPHALQMRSVMGTVAVGVVPVSQQGLGQILKGGKRRCRHGCG